MVRIDEDELMIVGNGIYAICPKCHHMVRVNKPLLGSVHICVGDD